MYICRSINVTILQNLLYLNCLYLSTWMIPVLAVHITLPMPLYSVCVGGGGVREGGCVLICLKMQIESRCLIIFWSSL